MTLIQMLWLADIMNGVSGLIIFISIFIFICVFGSLGECEESDRTSLLFKGFGLGFFFLMVGIIIPSKTAMYEIIAVKYSQELAQSPKVKDISEKVLKVLDKELDKLDKDK